MVEQRTGIPKVRVDVSHDQAYINLDLPGHFNHDQTWYIKAWPNMISTMDNTNVNHDQVWYQHWFGWLAQTMIKYDIQID